MEIPCRPKETVGGIVVRLEVPRFVVYAMWISALLLIAFSSVSIVVADKIDGCQILQTTDPRTPCYILIKQAPYGVPPFVYMLNLPRSTPQTPCPVSQTLDASFSCYVPPVTNDDPAFILNVPLPPGADDIDESPAGKAKFREAKTNPIFRKEGSPLDIGKVLQVGLSQKIGQSEPFRQTQAFSSSDATNGLTQYDRQPQPIGQTGPIGRTQLIGNPPPQHIGQSQPRFSSSFDLSYSARLPQPIGLTQQIGQTQPIGPPSPQLTMALFKPLAPSHLQIQPPSSQNQFIFRTVPKLFQPQLTQTAPNFPRMQTFHQSIQHQNQQPLYYTSFTQSAQKDSFPYPSSEGQGSISAFQGPYPPSY